MSKVNWKAKYENEYVANFKILQQAFDRMSVNKPIDVHIFHIYFNNSNPLIGE